MVLSLKCTLLAAAAPSVLAAAPAFIPHNNAQSAGTNRFAKPQQGDDKLWTVDEPKRISDAPVDFKFPNPFAEIIDIFTNFDDVVDDFFNKRMGNGEIFYGKRKYKPSGTVESEYNGGGFSDWRKIEAAREFREERARIREEEKARNNAEQ
jgi:hypothetical protein